MEGMPYDFVDIGRMYQIRNDVGLKRAIDRYLRSLQRDEEKATMIKRLKRLNRRCLIGMDKRWI